MARVQVEGSVFLVALEQQLKLRQSDDGKSPAQQVFHSVTGEAMTVISLTEVFEGRAQVIKITVPESGIPEGARLGALVRPVGLVCSPWGNRFNDQINTGLAYRAERIELLAPGTPAPVAASAGETRAKGSEAQK